MSMKAAITRGAVQQSVTNGYSTETCTHGAIVSFSNFESDGVSTASQGYYVKLSRDRLWHDFAGVVHHPGGTYYTARSNVLIIDAGYVPSVLLDTKIGGGSPGIGCVPYVPLAPTNYGTKTTGPIVNFFDAGYAHVLNKLSIGGFEDPVSDSMGLKMIALGTQNAATTGTVPARIHGGWR